MPVSRLATLSLSSMLAACGPRSTPAATESSSTAASSSAGEPTTGAGTNDTSIGSSTDEPAGSTTSGPTTSTSTTGDAVTTGATDDTTGVSPCDGATCEENEHCTPEARVNADIEGTTPLGPFAGTFAFASAALAFGELGIVRVIPVYGANICIAAPMLTIEFASGTSDGDFAIEATISIDDGEGQVVQTTTTVQIRDCCQFLWFCECENPAPYEVELDVAGDGWALAGTARPNCCRSYSLDEGA